MWLASDSLYDCAGKTKRHWIWHSNHMTSTCIINTHVRFFTFLANTPSPSTPKALLPRQRGNDTFTAANRCPPARQPRPSHICAALLTPRKASTSLLSPWIQDFSVSLIMDITSVLHCPLMGLPYLIFLTLTLVLTPPSWASLHRVSSVEKRLSK